MEFTEKLIKKKAYTKKIIFFYSKILHFFSTGDISMRRLKLWEECFEELLSDQLGRETLERFLDKEYSGENLRFWWEVNFF